MNGCSCCHFDFWMFVLLDKVFSGCAFLLGDLGGGFLNVLPFLAMINMNIYSNPAS